MTKIELAEKIAGNRDSLHFRQLLRLRKSELQSRLARHEEYRSRPKTTTHQAGEVHRFDYQADIYGGQYRLVSFDSATGAWEAERLAPDAETFARIFRDAETGGQGIYLSPQYADHFEQAEAELQERERRAGTRLSLTFVSAATYAAMF